MALVAELVLQTRAALAEGALWDSRQNLLCWVDILGRTVYQFDPRTGRNDAMDAGSEVGTVVPRRSGGLVLALRDGFAALDPQTRRLSRLADVPVSPGVRFNDGKCDPAGRLWAGTIAKDASAKLYRLDADLSVHDMLDGVTVSNGIVWTGDAKTMYYIDSPTRQVAAFDYDNASGAIANRRVAVHTPPELGNPDGMAIDEHDKLWIAMWGSGRVCRFDPKTGALLDTVHVPGTSQTSSCAFGGEELDELYITAASEHFTEEDWKKYPLSGSLFRVKAPVRGVPSAPFVG